MIAHKYQVNGLLATAERYLASGLNVDNALNRLKLSILYEREYLTSCVVSFIGQNLKEFVKQATFYETVREVGGLEIYESIFKAVK